MEWVAVAILCSALLVLPACVPASPAAPPASEVSAGRDRTETPDLGKYAVQAHTPRWSSVPYLPGGSAQQRLDIYLPEDGQGPYPTILAIHGGGFVSRSKLLYAPLARSINDLGYALVPIDFRLAPHYSYPAQVEDAFCALAWTHENGADYDLDSDRIVVMGDSAGGYLAAMLGTIETQAPFLHRCPYALPASNPMQGVVVLYGLYDFASLDGYPPESLKTSLEPYWGAEHGDIPAERLAEMSPASWVDGSEPPFLIVHGVQDTAVPSWMSEEFAALLEGAGAEVELVLLEAGHAFIIDPVTSPANSQALEAIGDFLSRVAPP